MSVIGNIFVPNVGPKNAKIAFVGEAPGFEEEKDKLPFVGLAGEKLNLVLNRNGLQRSDVYIANLCGYRPAQNKFENLLNTDALRSGLDALYSELRAIKPNVIVALGNWPMWFLTMKCGKEKGKLNPGSGILERRGSVYPCVIEGLTNTKVVCTLHPSFVNRNAEYYPAFDQDIKRAVSESLYPEFRTKARHYVPDPTVEDLELLRAQITRAEKIAIDIETFGDSLACVGVATSAHNSVCIQANSHYNKDLIRYILSTDVPKVFHFGTFDTEYLRNCGYTVNNWVHDTFILQRVLWPQLPRTLAYLCSIYTDIPYYKEEGKEVLSDSKSWGGKADLQQLWMYNCKDCVVTYEACDSLLEELNQRSHLKDIYEFDMKAASIDAPIISRTGMLLDGQRRNLIRKALIDSWIKSQEILNSVVLEQVSKKITFVPGTSVPQLVNASSSKQVQYLVYDKFKMRPRRKKAGQATVDENALISLLSEAKKEFSEKKKSDAKDKWMKIFVALKAVKIIRGIKKKLSSYIDIRTSADGRIRSLFKLGAETGRWSAGKWIDGSGLNAQTFPRDTVIIDKKEIPLRSMIVAQKGCVLLEFDLSQAETWVTAYLAEERMMKQFLSCSDIHTETSAFIYKVPFSDVTTVQRFLGKKANHQLSYGSTYYRLAQSINEESDNPPFVTVSFSEAKAIHDGWHSLYTNIRGYWWPYVQEQLRKNRKLVTPYGREAVFFKAWGDDLFKTAYAYVPQSTVADHLNGMPQSGVSKLGGLRKVRMELENKVNIINQSHDSFLLEVEETISSEIAHMVSEWLYRPLVINGEQFYIPVDCKIGDRWGELEKVKLPCTISQ